MSGYSNKSNNGMEDKNKSCESESMKKNHKNDDMKSHNDREKNIESVRHTSKK